MSIFANIRNPGVQSYCLRGFKDNAVVAQKTKAMGYDSIEICAVHADFADPAAFAGVVDIYKKAGVAIGSMGVQTFTGDEAKERKWFECAKIAGAKYLTAHFTVGTYPEAVKVAMKLSDEFGIRLAIHCHGGYMFGGSFDVIEHLLKISGPQIGVCIDTAWCLQTGRGNPVEWVEKFGERLYGMHYKDFTFDRAAKWTDVIIGTGNLKLPELLKAMEKVGFKGHAVIEYEGDVEKPDEALKACLQAAKKA
ncbi:MAG: sugar phosphate isomerase/epimerase [Spirochaetes bacterium]|nr:sugar phosphate isomerase/epimerase [Spirochaetota bacterium]